MTEQDHLNRPFDHKNTENNIQRFWEQNKFFESKPNRNKKPFTIVMPPPNVTGDLTMGHMMYTLQDILIRWHRAAGFEACWIPGTDHASIATEAKVTKLLSDKGISKKDIGREKFLEHAYAWKEEYGNRIVEAFKRLGISCDWSRSVFTMDESYSKSVLQAIVKLYKDGLIYKACQLVNWCPLSQSVISDEEVITQEVNGNLWHIRYHVHNKDNNHGEFIVVATTRPETLFGDLAVAVHPEDERYKHLIGKEVIVPVCNRVIPIIADRYVEKDFGSGVVKITPAHDKNDFEVGKRHNLGLLNVMNPDASMNDNAPEAYQGLTREKARQKLVAELKETGHLETVLPHRMAVGYSERGNVPIEFYLSEQWYIKMDTLAAMALEATRSKSLTLVPAFQEKVWEHWLSNIHDWCISRQLWWGHRLPFYTCSSCQHIHAEVQAPTKCEKCGHSNLIQENDVIDTWASSWIWPFGVHHWANPTEEQQQDLNYYYPTDVIITGADIIFFWIARMVMAGCYFTEKIPFRSCYFTPIIRDAKGRKMSKSLGNSPDISQIMSKYGTDAMRFSLVNQIVSGQDIHWKDNCCEIGKNFANKLWNSARFLTMNAEKINLKTQKVRVEQYKLTDDDPLLNWIGSEFFHTTEKVHKHVSKYEFAQYTSSLYEFSWMVFCDWFVELIKPRLSSDENNLVREKTLVVGLQIFDGILRLLHPVMPFVTEELWQTCFADTPNITLGHAPLPQIQQNLVNSASLKGMRDVQNVVGQIRTIRGQFNIHPSTELQVFMPTSCQQQFSSLIPQMCFLAKAQFHFEKEKSGFCAAVSSDGLEYFVSLEGLVDRNAEKERLQKKRKKTEEVIAGLEKKLGNSSFVEGAPEHILEGAKKQLAENLVEQKLLLHALQSLEN